MPGVNKFLPFGQASANVLNDTEWAADPDRTGGHVAGTIARSQLENKALRQATVGVAALMEFVAANQDSDVADAFSVSLLAGAIDTAIANKSAAGIATTTAHGVVELATNGEVQNGTAIGGKALVVTPAALATLTATLVRAGLIKLASEAETIANTPTEAAKAVTPATLGARTANTTRRGLVELATAEEAAAGTDTERAVTPAGLAAAITPDQDLASPGYTVLPGGFIMQWGSFDSTGEPAQVFPLEFPTACFGVQLTMNEHTDRAPAVAAISATGFTPDITPGGLTVYWFAYGH